MRKSWKELNQDQRQHVAARVMREVRMLGYESVSGGTQKHRAASVVELTGEDGILKTRDRNRATNQQRQQMRNAPMTRIIDQQLRVNVVGLLGGKLTLTTGDAEKDKAAQKWFNEDWAPQAEFTDGLHFNELLKLSISSTNTGGDVVLLFDDGTLCDSGKIRAFESDEICNFKKSDFETKFNGKGYTQSQGRVYDRFSRAVGVIVSASQRGSESIDIDKGFMLSYDPATERRDSYWVMYRGIWRFNQGRGVSPSSTTNNTLSDIHSLVASETEAAKLNSKLLGQVLDASEDELENYIPPEYQAGDLQPEEELALGVDEEITAVEEEQEIISLRQMDEIGAFYDLMPPKLKMELFDTKRPNEKIIEFVDWLSGNASAVYGLGRIYATLNPLQSYTAFRGAQCLSWPSIEEMQKNLERYICDWAGRNALRWGARKHGVILPEGWERGMSWQWPTMREVNELTGEKAREAKLKNGSTTFKSEHGPNWEAHLMQVAAEIAYCKKIGMIHPAMVTASGQVIADNSQNEGSE